jgi:GNAT superfamily N-acetyltransferase
VRVFTEDDRLSPSELARLLAACRGDTFANRRGCLATVRMFVDTGARLGEIVGSPSTSRAGADPLRWSLVLKIREFSLDDIEAVVDLMSHLGYPTSVDAMARRMNLISSDPAYHTLVAEYENEIAGFVGIRKVLLYESDHVAVQVAALVTKPEYRGMGIGRSLIKGAEEWARCNGASSIYLTSGDRPERENAHRFYRHLGYDITGYRFSKSL